MYVKFGKAFVEYQCSVILILQHIETHRAHVHHVIQQIGKTAALRPLPPQQHSVIASAPSCPGSEPQRTSNALATIQLICFLPQNISSKFSIRRLNPRPAVRIPDYTPTGRGTAGEKAGFTAQEETTGAKEEVRRNIAKSCRLQKSSDVWNGFYTCPSKMSSCDD